ncbi:MAG: restriction endonuclease subunit S, partial [Veillonella sp.]|nr:restriction endonuclease subunit S [Veillonella sp.]
MSKEKRRVPKLRFPGFTEDWEQRKLGSLATVEMNKRIFKEQTTIKGDIPFYKIGTFGSDADSFISRELFKEYKNKYPYPNIGDILISASGSIGRTVVYNGEDAYYQDSNIVWLNHNGKIDNSFLLQFYNRVKWAGLEGSTIKRLYNKNILETNIALPKIEEQRLIGKFFELVDRSITLHQRKLNNLKLKKKALLQKLFPKNEERYPELRFPGFTDAWEQRKFKDIAFKRGKISEADLPYVEFEDINSGIGTLNKNISQKVGHKKGLLFEAGDVLFGKLRPYLQNWLLCQFAGIAVGDFWVLQPQNVSSAFLYYLIQSEAYQSVAN